MLPNCLKNCSIRRKLTLLVQAAVVVALGLSCTAFALYQRHSIRESIVTQLSALAGVLGSNCSAALLFDDADAAKQLLSSIEAVNDIELACVYNAQGDLFACYLPNSSSAEIPPSKTSTGHRFTDDGHLNVTYRIESDGEFLGVILLHSELKTMQGQLSTAAMISALATLIAFAASHLIAQKLQRAVSGPILALAKTAEQISKDKDYSIRVEKTSEDELGVLYEEFNRMLGQVEAGKLQLQQAQDELEQRVKDRTEELAATNQELKGEIAERLRAEEELETVHRDLVNAARHAGMAEIASGVLHNVGNVLNSVNVSASTITAQLETSKALQLDRVVELLEQNRHDLGGFLTNDPKGKHVPALLGQLAKSIDGERDTLQTEAALLSSNIEHIKAIISMQQSYAGVSGVVEPLNVNTLLEDALRLHANSFVRHQMKLVREFADLPPVLIDKQRFLQIVVNLIKNAKESIQERDAGERCLTLRTQVQEDRLVVQVSDTGMGIAPDKLSSIFSHGYTTKADGHGFGLHSCANAAAEMDGELSVHSDGPMQGATFTLTLPYETAAARVLGANPLPAILDQ